MSPWAPCALLNEEVSQRRAVGSDLRMSAEISAFQICTPHLPSPGRQGYYTECPPGCGLCCPSPVMGFTVSTCLPRNPAPKNTALALTQALPGMAPTAPGAELDGKAKTASGTGCVPLLGCSTGLQQMWPLAHILTGGKGEYPLSTLSEPAGPGSFSASLPAPHPAPARCTVKTRDLQMANQTPA